MTIARVVVIGLLLAACTSVPVATPPSTNVTPAFGPLTVFGGADEFPVDMGTSGDLRITDACLFLEHPSGSRTELYWPAERTTWNGADRTVRFLRRGGQAVTLASGDHLELAGSDGPLRPGGSQLIARPPQSPCATTARFAVLDVVTR